jgi:hypothetical protein
MGNKVTMKNEAYGEVTVVFPQVETLNPLQWIQLVEHLQSFKPE